MDADFTSYCQLTIVYKFLATQGQFFENYETAAGTLATAYHKLQKYLCSPYFRELL